MSATTTNLDELVRKVETLEYETSGELDLNIRLDRDEDHGISNNLISISTRGMGDKAERELRKLLEVVKGLEEA